MSDIKSLPKLEDVEKEVYRRFGAMNPTKRIFSENAAYDINNVFDVTEIMYEGGYVTSMHFFPKCKLNKTKKGSFFNLFDRTYRTCKKRKATYSFEDDCREWHVEAYCINDYAYTIFVQRKVKLRTDFIKIIPASKRICLRPPLLDVKLSFDEAMLDIVNDSKEASKQYGLLAKLDEAFLDVQ